MICGIFKLVFCFCTSIPASRERYFHSVSLSWTVRTLTVVSLNEAGGLLAEFLPLAYIRDPLHGNQSIYMSSCSTDVQQSSRMRCWGLHAQIFNRIEQQRGEILSTDWTTGPTSFVSILCTLALGTQGGASNPPFHVLLSLQSLWNFVVLYISFKERKSFTQVKLLQELLQDKANISGKFRCASIV